MATTSRRNDKSIAAVKQSFKEAGVFYTDEALALYLKSFIPDGVSEVYDPHVAVERFLPCLTTRWRNMARRLTNNRRWKPLTRS